MTGQRHAVSFEANQGVHVCEDALDALMPLHLRVDHRGCVVAAGRTTKKLFRDTALIGRPLNELMRLKKPRFLVGTEEFAKLVGHKLVFETTLSGAVELQAMLVATSNSAEWLFNFSLGANLSSISDAYGLLNKDFSLIDSSIDLMLVTALQANLLSTSQDLTTRLETSRMDAERRALTDDLTGLSNRAAFQKAIEDAVAASTPASKVALLCVDLDNFKSINDTLGHDVGDSVLRESTRRLREATRKSDFIFRLGGDEFAIIQTGENSTSDCESLAARIIEVMCTPFMLDGQSIMIGASVGVSMAPDNATSVEQLFKTADIALYRAKTEGRGRFCFFKAGMAEELEIRREMEIALRQALEREQFTLHFQPIVSASTGRILGYEALLRWLHPEKGMISPMHFIPLAEETGLIDDIGRWVLHRACQEAATWPGDTHIAINFSALQLARDTIIDEVAAALSASGLAPSRLEIEVTETVLLQDAQRALAVLNGLKQLGVRVSMDDFGTGYSSLSYLQKFPFDKVKLDKSFIDDLVGSEDAVAIVRAVVGLTHSLGKITVAEGVETDTQARLLRQEGCDELQGYLISKPLPADQLARFEETHTAQNRVPHTRQSLSA